VAPAYQLFLYIENYVDFYYRTLSSAGSPVFPDMYVVVISSVRDSRWLIDASETRLMVGGVRFHRGPMLVLYSFEMY